jgi:hypothetical protein
LNTAPTFTFVSSSPNVTSSTPVWFSSRRVRGCTRTVSNCQLAGSAMSNPGVMVGMLLPLTAMLTLLGSESSR